MRNCLMTPRVTNRIDEVMAVDGRSMGGECLAKAWDSMVSSKIATSAMGNTWRAKWAWMKIQWSRYTVFLRFKRTSFEYHDTKRNNQCAWSCLSVNPPQSFEK